MWQLGRLPVHLWTEELNAHSPSTGERRTASTDTHTETLQFIQLLYIGFPFYFAVVYYGCMAFYFQLNFDIYCM